MAEENVIEPKTAENYRKYAAALSTLSAIIYPFHSGFPSAGMDVFFRSYGLLRAVSAGVEPFALCNAADYLEQLADGANAREPLYPIGALDPQ